MILPRADRPASPALVLGLLAGATAAFAAVATAAPAAVDLALNRPYTCNCDILPGWDGLVDGTKSSDEPPECFATDNSADFPKSIVIDLGGICELTRVVVHNSRNGNTRQVVVALSTDGKDYQKLRAYIFPPDRYQPLVHTFAPRKARFVRLTFPDTWGKGLGGDNIIYLREVEVFGHRLDKSTDDSPWPLLANAKAASQGPSWTTARRYLEELKRPARLAIFTDSKPGDLIGPDCWVSEGMRAEAGAWSVHGVKLVSFSTAVDGDKATEELDGMFDTSTPDLLMILPSSEANLSFLRSARRFAETAASAGVGVIVVLPPPPKSKKGKAVESETYRKLRTDMLAMSASAGAAILDGGAALAKAKDPDKLLGSDAPVGEGVTLMAHALAELLYK